MWSSEPFNAPTSGTVTLPFLDGSESDGTQLLADNASFQGGNWLTATASIADPPTHLGPDGNSNATELRGTTDNDRHLTYQLVTIPANTALTLSLYAKQNQYRYLQMLPVGNGTTSKMYAYFDMQTGTVTDSGILVSNTGTVINQTSIQHAVNGFYKCSFSFTLDTTGTSMYVQFALSDVPTYGAPYLQTPQYLQELTLLTT